MGDSVVLLSLLAAVALAFVHLLAGGVKTLHVVPHSRWLSLAGGVSVAYVFIHPRDRPGLKGCERRIRHCCA